MGLMWRKTTDLKLVLLGRIELPTSSLPMMCSTTELQQQRHWRLTCHRCLRFASLRVYSLTMNEKLDPPRTVERKKREALALKANMRRRKEQAKADKISETTELET
jgi:hypothetical protein